MTHDELLERIDYMKYPVGDSYDMNEESKAIEILRAVVELHKPKNFILQNGEVVEQWCTADNNQLVPYPCPTIQAIEKELDNAVI